jgi:hypothetical protein
MRMRLLRFLGLGAVLAALLAGPSFSQSSGPIVCTGDGGCPQPGYLCCYSCGSPVCPKECLQAVDGHCPIFP